MKHFTNYSIPDKPVIADERDSQGDGKDKKETERPRYQTMEKQDLKRGENTHMDQIQPVGGIRDISECSALFPEIMHEEPKATKHQANGLQRPQGTDY